MNRFQPPPPPFTGQRGAALITSLIFLIVLTLIGITAARMSGLEERMSGNLRDRSLAMQAAELALRDAELDILNSGRVVGVDNFEANCNDDGANNTNDDGLCMRRGGQPNFTNTTITFPAFAFKGINHALLALNMTASPSVAYGRFTGAGAIPALSAQPRYIVEAIRLAGNITLYRITVRAQGINNDTVVWLQEVFRP